jgi:hypothetical protein
MFYRAMKARSVRAYLAVLLAFGAGIVPLSSASAQSTYQTARHVFPWAQQMAQGTPPDYDGYYPGPVKEDHEAGRQSQPGNSMDQHR